MGINIIGIGVMFNFSDQYWINSVLLVAQFHPAQENDLKLFLKASKKVRAKRRYDELIKEGYKVKYKDILENIVSRDSKDTKRKDSPLIIAKDAVVIDNSELSINDQLDIIIKLIDSNL